MNRYKSDLEESKRRVEAWWQGEIIDRAVIQVTAPLEPGIEAAEAALKETVSPEQFFTDPAVVIPRQKQRLAKTYFGGEAFPLIFPVSIRMVAALGNYLGCPMRFVNHETTWSGEILDDWADRPSFAFDPQNHWWQISRRLLAAGVEASDGYYVGGPDLNGPTEILARLRGTQRLAFDFMDRPAVIKPALAEINRAWYDAWQAVTAITQRLGGYFYWMGIWSERPSIDLQSDFSIMISQEMFNEYFLPFIAEQTEMVERTIYHLDGPGAVRHLEALLDLPKLTGIQWIPGAGAKPAVEWLPLLQRIQAAGKRIVVYCEPDHVPRFLQALRPEGLMMITECANVAEAEQLLAQAVGWSNSSA